MSQLLMYSCHESCFSSVVTVANILVHFTAAGAVNFLSVHTVHVLVSIFEKTDDSAAKAGYTLQDNQDDFGPDSPLLTIWKVSIV